MQQFLYMLRRWLTSIRSILAIRTLRFAASRSSKPPELDADAVRACNPSAVHAILTPFGLSGPKAGLPSTDLIRLAAGGLLSLGGYPDTEPVAAFGEQSTVATGIYGAVAIILALLE